MLFNASEIINECHNRLIPVKPITLYTPQHHLTLIEHRSHKEKKPYRFKKFKLDLLMPTYKLTSNIDTNLTTCNFVTLITKTEQLRKVNVVFDKNNNKKYEEFFETKKGKINRIDLKFLSFISNHLLVITVKTLKSFKVAQDLLDKKWSLHVNSTDKKMIMTATNDDNPLEIITLSNELIKVYQLTISQDEIIRNLKISPIYNVIRDQILVTIPIEKLLLPLNDHERKLDICKKAVEFNLL